MRITRRQLRRLIREAILNERKGIAGGSREEVPGDIQKRIDKNRKMGIPSTAVYDEESGEWKVEEQQ